MKYLQGYVVVRLPIGRLESTNISRNAHVAVGISRQPDHWLLCQYSASHNVHRMYLSKRRPIPRWQSRVDLAGVTLLYPDNMISRGTNFLRIFITASSNPMTAIPMVSRLNSKVSKKAGCYLLNLLTWSCRTSAGQTILSYYFPSARCSANKGRQYPLSNAMSGYSTRRPPAAISMQKNYMLLTLTMFTQSILPGRSQRQWLGRCLESR